MKMSSLTMLRAGLLALACCSTLPAHAALFEDDEARRAIIDLRSRVDSTRDSLGHQIDGKADKSSTLELANQNEQLRAEIARLRGQIEVLTNELANEQRRQKSFYTDLDARLRKLEPQRLTVDGKQVDVGPNEQRLYDAALSLFKAGDYRAAASAFSGFIANHPGSGYNGAAYYWLGSSHYALRDYKSAIAAHQVVVNRYPDNPRAPDSMLNIATSYQEQKDRANARNTLDALITQYPTSQAAQAAKERLPKLK
ncbi:tol-pal system protein YbgF [Lacisediminimonas sp.]|uniref:tol-pal system protein YbgF n=1 Tax=Lacisediminimonas sp. TaxID=3060582 RepID=UPI002715ED82|nr:tol-pal system protein YbgF [Lacisediminimonas sp.]MDO8299112.1 tol-pal system protein YbgF [Lacisediminimonas sp.]